MKKLFNIIAVVAIIALLLISYSTYHKLCNVTTEHNTAVQRADSLEAIAANLRQQNDSIDIAYAALEAESKAKDAKLRYYIVRIADIKAENDSLKNRIPLNPDSVYIAAQIAAPDTMPKIYPFSARQTVFYYSEYIDNIGNRKLLSGYENAISGCLDYSQGLGKQIELLNVRNSNTEKQLALADLQTGLFKTSSENLNNRVADLEKWQPYYKAGMVVSFIIGFFAGK